MPTRVCVPNTSRGTRSFLSRYAYQLSVGGFPLRTGSPELVAATALEITAARKTAAALDHGNMEPLNKAASGGIHSVAEQHPTEFVKFNRGLRALQDELQETPADEGLHPYPWQQRLLDMVTGDPDDRTIVWVLDRRGGVGKSRLAKHLVLNYGAILLEGRLQDMCYTYNKEPIAVFDISRAAAEHSDHLYSMAEKLKNGLYLSTKYESRQKVFNPPHVIFFANQHPDYEKWSRDRIKVIDLDKEQRLERERSRSPVNQQGSPIM
eukprot:scaffold136367_cov16-Tisochrysis_lutea.AAC.2